MSRFASRSPRIAFAALALLLTQAGTAAVAETPVAPQLALRQSFEVAAAESATTPTLVVPGSADESADTAAPVDAALDAAPLREPLAELPRWVFAFAGLALIGLLARPRY